MRHRSRPVTQALRSAQQARDVQNGTTGVSMCGKRRPLPATAAHGMLAASRTGQDHR
jgi:hypothetical protein